MLLHSIDKEFSVYKTTKLSPRLLQGEFVFIGKTDSELSVICETRLVPDDALTAEHGWKCFRIAQDASFEKYGMISFLSGIIADQKASTLVIGTYDTDYLFVKKEKMDQVIHALIQNGCSFI